MKKSERACVIMQVLTENPNKDYSLGYFAEKFSCAKSSVSEDLQLVRHAMDAAGFGYIETTSGSKGGVRYVPYIMDEMAYSVIESIRARLEEPDRMLGGGFIYTADIMFNPEMMRAAAHLFARRFAATDADVVVTVEARGISVALETAELLNLPLVVIRRESSISDGSTVSINFFSGSTGSIQKMSLSKRALKPGSKAIIIDDFMRGGGSMKGVEDMLKEFDCISVGKAVVMSLSTENGRKTDDCYALFMLDANDSGGYNVRVNPKL